ncbi:pectate lyase [Rhodoligotrophos defluvii]|uniref:pectate lyase n=1 Tax=Rhodoligotrophos defluvii TaxID=2561934 RepID=UPI0010C96854|nr:pectate lyase [Rhodoligotrophos defluvii]
MVGAGIVTFACIYGSLLALGSGNLERQDAFPGAQGFGRSAQGGRSGSIIYVDNLNDAGPGSLRACIEASGARTCVFRVSGIIELHSSLVVEREGGFLSVLGQTAPGDGILITVRERPGTVHLTPLVIKNTHDVIVRHLRLRPQIGNGRPNVDGVTIENSLRVYLDHISTSWATDENINAHGDTTDLTIAYSIFGQGLRNHSKCALLGSDPTAPQRISFWRNACISNGDRNPDSNHYAGSCIEITNNVFFNARSEWSEIFTQFPGGTPVILRDNVFKAGPSTNEITFAIKWHRDASVASPVIFERGNRIIAHHDTRPVLVAPDTRQWITNTPSCEAAAPSIGSAFAAYTEVRQGAGAFPRDEVDREFMGQMGGLSSPGHGAITSEPGRLPRMRSARPYSDSDRDGMADGLEPSLGAVVGRFDPWLDGNSDGWTNLDEFTQWLSHERIEGRYPR